MTPNILRVVLSSLVFALSGCIYLPIIESEPYKENNIVSVQPGGTTLNEILDLFGPPDIERKSGSIWIHAKSRHVGYVMDLLSVSPGAFIEDYQFLVVEFDHDTVKNFELVEDKNGCSSTGICIVTWGIVSEQNIDPRMSIIASKQEDDQIAKEFRSIPGSCSLYIYTHDPWPNIEIDSNPYIHISDQTYLHFLLKPGSHKIRVRYDKNVIEQNINCGSNDLVFAELYSKSGMFIKPKSVINIVEGSIGRDEILKRNIVLSNLADKIQEQQYQTSLEKNDGSETCSIYVYCTGDCYNVGVKVNELESFTLGALGEAIYIKSNVLLGSNLVTATHESSNLQRDLEIHCDGKADKFVRVKYDWAFFGSGTIDLRLVDEIKARNAIEKRIRGPLKGDAE